MKRTVMGLATLVLVAAGVMTAAPASAIGPAASGSGVPAESGLVMKASQAQWQERAPALAAELTRALGPDRFGGLWIDERDNRIKVGIAGTPATQASAMVTARAAAHGLAGVTDTVSVRHSEAALVAANSWLGDQLVRVNHGAAWPLEAGYTTAGNAVRLGLPASPGTLTAAQQAVVRAAKERYAGVLTTYTYTDRVQADACDFPYCDPPLRAGVQINPTGCTLGFLGRGQQDGRLYGFTAGHCVNVGSQHSSQLTNGTARAVGPATDAEFSGNGDAAIIRVTDEAAWRARAWVYVQASEANDGVPGTVTDEDYQILRDGFSVVGMRICRSGVGSGTSCGRVRALGVTLTYGGVTVRDLGQAGYCRAGGDSGGPVYANNTAFGIHVAGSGCTGYYQGIRGAEDLMNVSLSFDG